MKYKKAPLRRPAEPIKIAQAAAWLLRASEANAALAHWQAMIHGS